MTKRGAFTGAQHRRIGRIEQAAGGTIFLDEIGDMPPGIQAKLLRLLQEKRIQRLGGHDSIDVDVRIIAATNANLEQAVADGRFREDLYYRLKVVTLRTPPLRERREDIPALAAFLLHRQAAELHRPDPGLEEEALRYLAGLDCARQRARSSQCPAKGPGLQQRRPGEHPRPAAGAGFPGSATPPAAGLGTNGNGDTGPAPGVRRSPVGTGNGFHEGEARAKTPRLLLAYLTTTNSAAWPASSRPASGPAILRPSTAAWTSWAGPWCARALRQGLPGQPLAGGPPAGPFPPHPAGAHGELPA